VLTVATQVVQSSIINQISDNYLNWALTFNFTKDSF